LNQQEKGLLQITRLPVYKMLNVQAAWTGPAALDVSRYADIIATDLLYQYLEESLEIVNRSAAALELPEAQMQPFQNGIDRARQAVAQLRHQTYEHLNAVLQLMQRTQMIETQLNSQLSSRISQSLQYVNQHGGGDEH
jgi:conjugative transfer pilus assembly protein TraH